MSDDTDDQIAKLEALLTRVRSRSRAPHPVLPSSAGPDARELPLAMEALRASPVPPASPLPRVPSGVQRFSPPPPPPPPPSPPPPPPASSPARKRHTSRPEVPVGLFTMRSPERYATATTTTTTESNSPLNGAWFAPEPPPMEVIELEVDPDPSTPPPPLAGATREDTSPGVAGAVPEPLESRSRLVIAPPSSPPDVVEPTEPPEEGDEPFAHAPSDPTIKASAEVPPDEPDALEGEEEAAPSSSRRPISIEAKMNEPDDAPTHTAPPESGRIPAASVLELTLDAERGETGPAAEAVQVSVASVVRAEPPRVEVAVFVSPPPSEQGAKTFGELLEEALSL